MAASALWTIFYLCLLVKPSKGQGCIQGRSGDGLPSFQDYRSFDDNRITRHQQAIITSYKFDCHNLMCGNITEWGVDVHPDGGGHQPGSFGIPYTLDLQVWRPSPTVDDYTGAGCYSLVGDNRFTSISLSSRVALVTPSPEDYIQFQPGDVLGVYVEVARSANDGVVILDSCDGTTSFTSELVWHASIASNMATSQNGDCPYSVGSSGVLNTLTQAAPVISVATVTFPCPPLLSLATTQPTPQPPNPCTTDGSAAIESDSQLIYSDSEGIAKTELRVPTTSETATDLPILSSSEPSDIGLIIGIGSTVSIVVIVATLSVVIIAALLLKKHAKIRKDSAVSNVTSTVPTAANQAYGLTHHNERVKESIYDYPEVDLVEARQNEAYVSNIDIITAENQAYAINTTENTPSSPSAIYY